MSVDDLVGSAYDAALDSSLWPSLLERTLKHFSANMVALRVMDAHGRDEMMLAHGDCLTPTLYETYARDWLDKDIHLRKASTAPWLWNRPALREFEIVAPDEERSSAYVNEFLRPLELGRIVTCISKDREHVATVAYHRSFSAPLLSDDALAAAQSLFPHLIRAARLTAARTGVDASRANIESLFGDTPYATFLLADNAHVLWLNAVAESLLRDGIFCLSASGALHGTGVSADFLTRLLARARTQRSIGGAPDALVFNASDTRFILRGRVIGRETWPCMIFQRAAVLLECAPAEVSRSTAERLRRSFGLTPAEAAVSLALAEDQSIEDIARQRGVAPDTVRAQTKAIMRKVGVSRRAALIQIVTRLSD